MKDMLIMTICGADAKGTIEELMQAPVELNAEVLSSKVMRFEGQMSAILKVAVAEGVKDIFAVQMVERFPNLQFFYSPVGVGTENTKVANRVNLVVDCKSRPGVEQELDGILQRLDYRVEKSEYTRCRVPNIGETVFSARYELVVPGNLSSEAVADEIEALTEGARVNVV